MKMPDMMIVWAIYDRPREFPDVYVAQKWEVVKGVSTKFDDFRTDADLENLRQRLINEESCGGCLPAGPDDNPEVVELWLPSSLFAN